MAYTAAALVATLGGLSITGVTRMYSQPPATVGNADLPVAYVRLPEVRNEIITYASSVGIDNHTCELVVLVEPVGLSDNATNFAAMVALIDNVNAALKTEAAANNRIDSWTVRQETAVVGESPFWALVASVEASG